jgi:hypothetical protein
MLVMEAEWCWTRHWSEVLLVPFDRRGGCRSPQIFLMPFDELFLQVYSGGFVLQGFSEVRYGGWREDGGFVCFVNFIQTQVGGFMH